MMAVSSGIIRIADGYCSMVRRAARAIRTLEDHWIGDLIGAVCLFGSVWILLVAGWVLQ